jgi:CubicO group peptidase (beta-lactamase class C family)
MDAHLFTPLGMTSSFSLPNAERLDDPRRARGYAVTGQTFAVDDWDPLDHLVGSGSIYSTVEDLARFDRALDAHTLLAPETLAEAFTPVQLNDGSRAPYGFGWEIDTYQDIASTGHSGSWQGFQAAYRRFPRDKLTIIILTNRTDIDPDTLVFDLVEHALP